MRCRCGYRHLIVSSGVSGSPRQRAYGQSSKARMPANLGCRGGVLQEGDAVTGALPARDEHHAMVRGDSDIRRGIIGEIDGPMADIIDPRHGAGCVWRDMAEYRPAYRVVAAHLVTQARIRHLENDDVA